MGSWRIGTHPRHRLNDRLRRDGGHEGDGVRPRFRGRGYAVQILQLSLEHLAALGIDDALVTVGMDNRTSQRVAERCGGRLDTTTVPDDDTSMYRYWVPTSP